LVIVGSFAVLSYLLHPQGQHSGEGREAWLIALGTGSVAFVLGLAWLWHLDRDTHRIQQAALAAKLARAQHNERLALLGQDASEATLEAQQEQAAEIQRLNRLHAVVGRIGQVLLRTNSQEALFREICTTMVQHGLFKLAWVAESRAPEQKPALVASHGDEVGYIQRVLAMDIPATLHPDPVLRAQSGGLMEIQHDLRAAAAGGPLALLVTASGYRSATALPIRFNQRLWGWLGLYTGENHVFSATEQELLAAVAQDITYALDRLEHLAVRDAAEAALRNSVSTLRAFFNSSDVFMNILELRGDDFVYLLPNQHQAAFLGMTEGELRGKSARETGMADDLRRQWMEILREVQRSGRPGFQEYPFEHRQRRGWFSATAGLIPGGTTSAPHFSFVAVDITERVLAEELLRKTTIRLNAIVQAAPVAVFDVDAKGRVMTLWNPAAETMLGYPADKVVGHPLPFTEAEQPGTFPQLLAQANQGESLNDVHLWLTRADGAGVNVSLSTAPLRAPDGTLAGTLAVLVDITLRKATQEALQRSQAFLRLYYDMPFIGMAITSSDDRRWLRFNDRICEILGYSRPELEQMTWPELTHPDDVASDLVEFESVLHGGSEGYIMDKRFVRKDGQVIYTTINVKCLRRADGTVEYFICTLQDITERKRAEMQMHALTARLQTVREEESTRIARELHDELGQSLTGIKFEVAWIGRRLNREGTPPDEAISKKLTDTGELIDSTIRKVRQICSELRPETLDELGLVPALQWYVHNYEERTTIPCHCRFPREKPAINPAAATALFRIFQEILTNVARHAEATEIKIVMESKPSQVVLTVSDDGRGIPEGALTNTRSLGVLGMRERAEAVGGQLVITGSPGNGTTVTVTVPTGDDLPEVPGLA
jgi:two-component system sensor histidine kinase UhpB